jgi:hypothetical protein
MRWTTENPMDEQEFEPKLRELLASLELPSSVSTTRYEIGIDHVGEPAVRVFLVLDPDFAANFDKEKLRRKELQQFSFELSSKILELESGYFPFVRLDEAA